MSENIEKVMGVEVFSWEGWDQLDTGHLQFYGVKFALPELLKYDDNVDAVTLEMSGNMKIYDANGNELASFNLGELKSFRDELNKLYE